MKSPQAEAQLAERAVELHRAYRGKIQILGKCPMTPRELLACWYTPGVAAAARAIQANPAEVFELTNRANSVAVVSDGSRVLGLGDIGPEAGLPVMEGKALLFKHFGGVDAVPLCLAAPEPEQLIQTVKAIAPSFGGINLEDIAAPKCFRVLDRLRRELPVPVWHDDQQGTAAVALAALENACAVVRKELTGLRIALIGIGAANMAVYRLLKARGVSPSMILACDSRGLLHRKRADLAQDRTELPEKWQVCGETNGQCLQGGIIEALRGADACIAFSTPGPNTIPPEVVAGMAQDAIVFACANPVPELWPEQAHAAGARIVATGRSDFPNQLNNSLVFPGLFRGVLDVQARFISEEMTLAAADAIAAEARRRGLDPEAILPPTDSLEVAVAVAVAVGAMARKQGLARLPLDDHALEGLAREQIEHAAAQLNLLTERRMIAPVPPD